MNINHRLPWEILAQVFCALHNDTLFDLPWTPHGHKVEGLQFDAMEPSSFYRKTRGRRFPCSTALVCKYWLKIHKDYPTFWTYLEFDLAQDPSLLADAFNPAPSTYFAVMVFDSRFDSNSTADPRTLDHIKLERDRVHIISDSIRPYLLHCLWLDFDVEYSSSLESIPLFLKAMDINKTLQLSYTSHHPIPLDKTGIEKWHFSEQYTLDTCFFALCAVHFDVRTMLSIRHTYPQFWSRFFLLPSQPFTLTVSDYTFKYYSRVSRSYKRITSISVAELLYVIRDLPTNRPHLILVLRNLWLNESQIDKARYMISGKSYSAGFRRITCDFLLFDNVCPNFISSLSREFAFIAKEIKFRGSKVPADFVVPSECLSLTFDRISHHTDVAKILPSYRGTSLTFEKSACFNDKLLQSLRTATSIPLSDRLKNPLLSSLELLELRACNNFSYPELKAFLKCYDTPSPPRPPIRFRGTDLRPLTQEEETWLVQKEEGVIVRRKLSNSK